MRARRWAVVVLGLGLAAPPSLAAQTPKPEETLARAAAALDATETERAVELLRQLVATLPPTAPVTLRRDAQLQLAIANWSLGLFDSASVHLQAAISADPFTRLDPEEFNPDLRALFRAAKSAMLVIGVRAAPDTVLPETDQWPVAVAVTWPGTVRVRLAGPGPSGHDTLVASASVDSTASIALPLVGRGGDHGALAPGEYQLTVEYADTAGRTATAALSLELARQVVDTLPHEPPPPDSLYRLEVRWGAPSKASLARGVGFGVGAGVIPVLLANGRMRGSGGRALTVGFAVSVAGLAGYFLGRTRQALPENIAYNRTLRSAWEARQRAIAAANDQRRGTTLVRVRVLAQR
jgi:hypothetical protein